MTATGSAPAATGAAPGRRMPGVEGFWVFVGGDLAIFTLLFGSFMHARQESPAEFEAARQLLDASHGGVNTLLLLTSSWCVASALGAVRRGGVPAATRWLGLGILGGVGFAASKGVEYSVKLGQGHGPGDGGFLMYYYVLTGIHLVHVLVGCLLLTVFWTRWRRRELPSSLAGFESVACYWHMVDLLWVVLFPLLYLTR